MVWMGQFFRVLNFFVFGFLGHGMNSLADSGLITMMMMMMMMMMMIILLLLLDNDKKNVVTFFI